MKISGNAIKVGNVLNHDGKLWVVTKTQHTQPGKGGAYMQVEMKAIKEGTKTNIRFRSAESVEKVVLEEIPYQYLYEEEGKLVLMDQDTFEQLYVEKELVGDSFPFLQDGMIVTVCSHEGDTISVAIPEHVVLEIIESEPVVKGQTASSSFKPAKLSNGEKIMVPPHIDVGTRVVVNTSDGSYVEKAKD